MSSTFRFRLASLLRLRQNSERMEEIELSRRSAKLAELRSESERLSAISQQWGSMCRDGLQQSQPAAELRYLTECREALARVRQTQHQDQQKAELRVLEQKNRLLDARRERETLSVLKKHQQETFAIAERRREQSVADELFLLSRTRTNRQSLPNNSATVAE